MIAPENRLSRKFQDLRAHNRKAFVAYITAGDPTPALTPDLVWALEQAGADVVELGVPFSDPLADGVVNQLSAQRALEAGTTPPHVLEIVRVVRTKSQIPLVLYTYFNLIYAYGVERFYQDAQAAGVDGLLILDLPPEEIPAPSSPGHCLGEQLVRISLIAPTTPPERMEKILAPAGGFIYYVSREGVTGMQQKIAGGVAEKIALLRRKTALPICVGFGISTPEQAQEIARQADGVVIGSVLVRHIEENSAAPHLPTLLADFARPFAEAIHSAC